MGGNATKTAWENNENVTYTLVQTVAGYRATAQNGTLGDYSWTKDTISYCGQEVNIYWNQWYNAMLYINDYSKMPLQYLIMDLARSGDALREIAQYTGQSLNNMPGLSLKMATTLVTIGPIVLLYPFVQRYFTSGLTVGAVKG